MHLVPPTTEPPVAIATGDAVVLSGPDHYRKTAALLAEYEHLRQRQPANPLDRIPGVGITMLEESIRQHLAMAQLGARLLPTLLPILLRENRPGHRDLVDRWTEALQGQPATAEPAAAT